MAAMNKKIEEQDIKQGVIAEALGVSRPRINQVLSGRRPHISSPDLDTLAVLLNADIQVADVGSVEGVALLEHLDKDSKIIPESIQQVLRYLALEVYFIKKPPDKQGVAGAR